MRWLGRGHRRQSSADQAGVSEPSGDAPPAAANGVASTSALPPAGRPGSMQAAVPVTSAPSAPPGVVYGPPAMYISQQALNQPMAQYILPNGAVVLRPAPIPYAPPLQPQPDWEMQLALAQSAQEHAAQERMRQQRQQEAAQAQQRKQAQLQAQQLSQKWWKTTW